MKIKEINISDFGSLKNKVLTLDAGLNVIYGENESGKSTVLLFIKYMLYGLGRRSASNSERERSVSWSGHSASGSMTFEHGGEDYRIERRYTDGGRERFSVTRLSDGEEINSDKTPGEYFLGVPKEVFESSAFVGQMRSSKIDGEKTAESIRNMLTTADESVDSAKILKNLGNIRVGYLHKNKNGGSLYEDEQRIIEYRRLLEKARDNSFALEEQIQKLDRAKADYEIVKRDLEAKDILISEMNKIIILERFDSLEHKRIEREDISKKREELTAATLKNGFFPTRDHIAELKHALKAFEDAQGKFSAQSERAAAESEGSCNAELAKLGERIEENGGADRILALVSEKKKKSKSKNAAIAALWGAQAVFSASAVLLMLSNLLWGAALFAFVIPAVIFTLTSLGSKKKMAREINDIAAEYGATAQTLEQRLEQAARELSLYRAQTAIRIRLEAELESAKSNLDDARSSLDALLCKTQSEEVDARAEIARLEAFVSEYDALLRDEDALSRIIEQEQRALAAYDCNELRSEISLDPEQISSASVSEAQRVRSFLAAKKANFEKKIMTLTSAVAELKASAADPLTIADELAELEEKHAADTEFFEALTLAMESIEQAGQLMSGSVTPAISKRASEVMARISADKYTVLRTTGTLGLSLDSEGFGVKSDLLSDGTRDAAYLALRIALFSRIYGAELPPLMLDEALCQFDDTRAERMLLMLDELTREGAQCLCFTSHKREGEILLKNGVEYCGITL